MAVYLDSIISEHHDVQNYCSAPMMPKKYSVQKSISGYQLINRLLMRKHILYALMMLGKHP